MCLGVHGDRLHYRRAPYKTNLPQGPIPPASHMRAPTARVSRTNQPQGHQQRQHLKESFNNKIINTRVSGPTRPTSWREHVLTPMQARTLNYRRPSIQKRTKSPTKNNKIIKKSTGRKNLQKPQKKHCPKNSTKFSTPIQRYHRTRPREGTLTKDSLIDTTCN